MTHDLPYTPAYGKIGSLFDRIAKAKVPDALTVKVLGQSFGLKSTNDRSLIPLLRKLGFIDGSGKPTPDYGKLKNQTTAGAAIAEGIKRAYSPLYDADEGAHALPPDELKGMIAQVSGAEDFLIAFIVGTFKNLVKLADFSKPKVVDEKETEKLKDGEEQDSEQKDKERKDGKQRPAFNPDFKFNIEINLPSNGTEETYLAIFNALRKSLG
jgi:hypothetical protein